MADTFNVQEMIAERDTILGWSFIVLMTELDKLIACPPEDKNYTVEVKINGHEVSFKHLIDRLQENYAFAVNKEAKRLLESKLQNVSNVLETLEGAIINLAFDKLGIDLNDR